MIWIQFLLIKYNAYIKISMFYSSKSFIKSRWFEAGVSYHVLRPHITNSWVTLAVYLDLLTLYVLCSLRNYEYVFVYNS